MRLNRVQSPGPRFGGMIGRWLAQIVAQKLAEAETVGCAPRNATLGFDALEVAQQQHPEVCSWRNRRTARAALVILPADGFDPLVELLRVQDRVQPLVKHVPWRGHDLVRRHPQILLLFTILLSPHAHRRKTFPTPSGSHVAAGFYHGLLGHKYNPPPVHVYKNTRDNMGHLGQALGLNDLARPRFHSGSSS